MNIQENIPLAEHTTFKIGGPARFFCLVRDDKGLLEAVGFAKKEKLPVFVLGGGSNILMSDKGFKGLVIKMGIIGIQEKAKSKEQRAKIKEDEAVLSVGAGEMWDGVVEYAVSHGLYGIENLSAIPGTAGAAPIQNIGAYGTEISETLVSVRALDTETMEFVELSNEDCDFSYRDSMFKRAKGRYIVTRVDIGLTKNGKLNLKYKDVKEYFAAKNNPSPTLSEVRQAVIDIRWNKLPDWKLWGTAGSFFKNPIIPAEHFWRLKGTHPDLPGFTEPDGRIKVSLGWILDKICDVRGLSFGNVSTYEKQALVIVARPGATSEEVVNLAQELMKRVKEKTGIVIEGEVEWVN